MPVAACKRRPAFLKTASVRVASGQSYRRLQNWRPHARPVKINKRLDSTSFCHMCCARGGVARVRLETSWSTARVQCACSERVVRAILFTNPPSTLERSALFLALRRRVTQGLETLSTFLRYHDN